VIFVSVGHQMPFDRMVRAVASWAEERDRRDLFAQVGDTNYRPGAFAAEPFLTPVEFRRHIEAASHVVSHAGTGNIIAALSLGKPLVVMPRRAELAETRNDHQLATARYFEQAGHLVVVHDEAEMHKALDELDAQPPPSVLRKQASPELLERLQCFWRDETRS